MTAPAAGRSWGYDTSQSQLWTTNLGASDTVNVLLSTDGGATFPTTLVTGVSASLKKATVLTPTLGAPVTTARIRVVWSNAPGGYSAAGTNPGNFKIQPAFVTVIAPNGGESWTHGTLRAIKWSNNLGTLENVQIELSYDSGPTYTVVLSAGTPSASPTGNKSLTMPATISSTARIKVTWLKHTTASDASNANFSIP